MSTEEKIIEVIDQIRPFLIDEGGNLEFVKYENGIVYVKLLGACSHCSMMDYTLKNGIEQAIVAEIPEVKMVENIQEEF